PIQHSPPPTTYPLFPYPTLFRSVQAKLYLLELGPRPEEVAENRHKVQRAKEWCELAQKDLDHARQALHDDLVRLDDLIKQQRSEDRKSTRLNSSHVAISYAVFCL